MILLNSLRQSAHIKKRQKAIKDKLLSVSVWSKKDLLIFEEIGKDINKWNIAKY